jgi:hypothetical protein
MVLSICHTTNALLFILNTVIVLIVMGRNNKTNKKQQAQVQTEVDCAEALRVMDDIFSETSGNPYSPSDIEYYQQSVKSVNFNKKKNKVIAQLKMQYWANKALAQQPSS